MLINSTKWYKNCTFDPLKQNIVFVNIVLDSIFTNNNTPFLPLNNAH